MEVIQLYDMLWRWQQHYKEGKGKSVVGFNSKAFD